MSNPCRTHATFPPPLGAIPLLHQCGWETDFCMYCGHLKSQWLEMEPCPARATKEKEEMSGPIEHQCAYRDEVETLKRERDEALAARDFAMDTLAKNTATVIARAQKAERERDDAREAQDAAEKWGAEEHRAMDRALAERDEARAKLSEVVTVARAALDQAAEEIHAAYGEGDDIVESALARLDEVRKEKP